MLLEHNYPVYQALEDMLAENNKAILVTATGTGKSYVALEYLERHDLRALVICPKHVICTAWEKLTDRVDTITYHKFSKLSKIPEYDCYIFDEAHHAGSKVWGKAVKDFMDTCAAPVIGLTADSKRYSDGGKDVAEELWDDCVVHGYDQAEAVEEGVLPDATYICTLFGAEERIRELGQQAIDPALWARLDYTLKNCGTMEDILKRHMPAGLRKGIVFVNGIDETEMAKQFIQSVYPAAPVGILHSRMQKQEKTSAISKFEEQAFGYLVAVDMLNEGLHIEGVNTVIMLRRTSSLTVFAQQLGQCLAPGNKDVVIFDFVGNRSLIKYLSVQTEAASKVLGAAHVPGKSKQVIVYDYASPVVAVLNDIQNTLNGAWLPEEDAILKSFYPAEGSLCAERLAGRTRFAVIARARTLGVRRNRSIWGREEDDIILKNYKDGGPDLCEKLLSGKTKVQIMQRAAALGVKRTTYKLWSAAEDEVIKKYYPIEGAACAKRLGVSDPMVKTRASKLGVRFLPLRNRWTSEEDDFLREHYPTEGRDKCASQLPGKTPTLVKQRVKELGLKTARKKKWSEEEEQLLRDSYAKEGRDCVRFFPGRTKSSVINRARMMGLYTEEDASRQWSTAEDAAIREYFPLEGTGCASRLPGKSRRDVLLRAHKLGITTRKRWSSEEDAILRAYYRAERQDITKRLPGRTYDAIMQRAKAISI